MTKTITINNKESLKNFRKDLENKGYQELRLEYKQGAYQLTYSTEPIPEVGLVYLGYKKNKKAGEEGHFTKIDFLQAGYYTLRNDKKNIVKQVIK